MAVWHNVNTNTILFSFMILGYKPIPSFLISNVVIQVSKPNSLQPKRNLQPAFYTLQLVIQQSYSNPYY